MKKTSRKRATKTQQARAFHLNTRWVGLGLLMFGMLVQSFGLLPTQPAFASSLSLEQPATTEPSSAPTTTPPNLHPLGNSSGGIAVSQELAQRAQASAKTSTPVNISALLGSATAASKQATPAVRPATVPTFVNTYYAGKFMDDAGSYGGANCTTSSNTTCSLRSALNQAAADAHGTSFDLIKLAPYSSNAYSVNVGTYGALPAVPDYVYLSSTADLSCPSFASSTFGAILGSSVTAVAGLQLGNHDYINEVVPAFFGTGISFVGSNNIVTCSLPEIDINGIVVNAGAANNQIGGVFGSPSTFYQGFEMVASGSTNGIVISGTGTTILNTDILNNSNAGILLGSGATNNQIGSAATNQTNAIGGNGYGLVITGTGTSGNSLFGNHIGVDITGTTGITNTYDGVLIGGGASGNHIGGGAAGQGNLISSNGNSGILVYGASNNNVIQGNLIGVKGDYSGPLYNGTGTGTTGSVCNPSGSATQSEDCQGILLTSDGTTGPTGTLIGGNFNAGQGNLVASNGWGVGIDYSNGNTVQGNSIGARITGSGYITFPTPFGVVLLNSASNNLIGGDSSQGQGNFIAGTSSFSIYADSISPYGPHYGSGTNGNKIQGNAIGEDFSGNTIPSFAGNAGIVLLSDLFTSTVSNNLIGVDLSVATPNFNQANLVGNQTIGIAVAFSTTVSNQINGNKIGVNPAATTSTTGNLTGILLVEGSSNTQVQNNIIGAANLTSTVGIALAGSITNTVISKNYIGTNSSGADLHNSTGISLTNEYSYPSPTGGPHGTIISQNVIGLNQGDGIDVGSDATDNSTQRNTISQNSIFRNTGLGINLHYSAANPNGLSGGADTGPNNQAATPTLASATIGANSGVQATGTASPNSTVEVFLGDSTGITTTQGRTYLGTTTANGSGNFSLNAPLPAGVTVPNTAVFVATDTLNDPAFPLRAGSTSQFSAPLTAVVLPALTVNPTSLSFTAPQGGANPAAQSVSLSVVNGSASFNTAISYSTGANGWLSVNPTSGTVNPGSSIPVTFTVTTNGLAAGTYTATVTFQDTVNSGDKINVPVTLTVTPVTSYTYYLPFLANNASSYTSYLAFQNIGTATASFTLKYYDSTGAAISAPSLTGTCAALVSHGECLPPNPFSSGAAGSGVIVSNQPLNVIVAEATPYGGSAYAVSNGASNSLVAPIILKGAYGDFNTRLTVFNGGTSAAAVSVTFYDQNGNVQTAANQSQSVGSNTAWTLDQASSALPANFNGWAQISAPSGSQLVAQVLEQSQSRKFVAIANAQPTSKAATTLYAPAIFKGAFGFVTGANIVNPNANPVQVTITYYDDSGTAYNASAFTLNANSTAAIYQSGSGTGLPSSPALPNGFSGAATVKSNGGNILMVVNESGGVSASGTSLSGVYAAANSGGNAVGLPVMANGGFGYVTGATVLNTSSNTVNGSIQYYNVDGTTQGSAHNFSIGPNASQLIYQGDPAQGLSSSGGGFYGTAVITEGGSGSDLIVTTNAESGLFYTYTEPNN